MYTSSPKWQCLIKAHYTHWSSKDLVHFTYHHPSFQDKFIYHDEYQKFQEAVWKLTNIGLYSLFGTKMADGWNNDHVLIWSRWKKCKVHEERVGKDYSWPRKLSTKEWIKGTLDQE